MEVRVAKRKKAVLLGMFPTVQTIAIFCVLVSGAFPAKAQDARVVERLWSELLPIVGEKIAISLPDGSYVQGKTVAIEPDNLKMNVEKTSSPGLHPVGTNTIPRAMIDIVEIRT